MADKKITALTVGFPALTDLAPYVSSPLSSPVTKAAYISSFLGRGAIAENSALLVYDSATGYHVTAGGADVNGVYLVWASSITRSSLSFTANTIYYVYLYSNSGTPAVEESTTAPVWDSALNYYKKTGDATRRCIGFIEASATNTIRKFLMTVNGRSAEIVYIDGVVTGKAVVTTSVSESSWTSVSLAPLVPANISTHVSLLTKFVLGTIADDLTVGICPIDLGAGVAANGANDYKRLNAGIAGSVFLGTNWNPISTSQTIYYRTTRIAGTPTATIEAHGARIMR